MSTPLDTALRDMLNERAGDIDTLPARLTRLDGHAAFELEDELLTGDSMHRSTWLLAAAVALVVAVAGAIIGIRQLGDHDTPPATSNSIAPTKPTPSPSKSPIAADVPLACKATLPDAWQTAIGAAPSAEGAQSAAPLQVLPNGDVLVARDFGQRQSRDLAIISPGKTPRSIFSVPDPQLLNVQSAGISGNWLMVSVGAHPRPAKGTIPGDSPMPNVVHLYVIDLRTGEEKQIDSTSLKDGRTGGRTINLAALLDGKVYWDVRARYGSRTGVINSYDLTTGKTHAVYSGEMGYLVSSPAGIGTGSEGQVYVHASLPSVVHENLSVQYPLSVATDGTAYAWEVAPLELGWWEPGLAKPRYIRLRDPAGFGSMLVSGHYVMTGQGGVVVDVAANAAADYSPSSATAPSRQLLSFGTTSFGRWVAAIDLVGTGHWQDGYWVDPQPELVQLDTSALPGLHC